MVYPTISQAIDDRLQSRLNGRPRADAFVELATQTQIRNYRCRTSADRSRRHHCRSSSSPARSTENRRVTRDGSAAEPKELWVVNGPA
jgi:hypothetical protein